MSSPLMPKLNWSYFAIWKLFLKSAKSTICVFLRENLRSSRSKFDGADESLAVTGSVWATKHGCRKKYGCTNISSRDVSVHSLLSRDELLYPRLLSTGSTTQQHIGRGICTSRKAKEAWSLAYFVTNPILRAEQNALLATTQDSLRRVVEASFHKR